MIPSFQPVTAGVDFGTRTVKGILLKKRRGRVHLDRFLFVDLQKEGIRGEQRTADALKALLEVQRFRNLRVSSALREDQVFNLQVTLPAMPEKDLQVAVRGEVASQLGKPEEELVIDYQVERDSSEGEPMILRAYASLRTEVGAHLEVLQKAGLRPYSVEIESLAAIEALRFNDYISEQSNFILVSVGESQTSIHLVAAGAVAKSKIEKVGMGSVGQRLQEKLGISADEAEAKKLAYNFAEDPNRSAAEQEQIEQGIFEISRAVKVAIEDFQESFPGVKAEKIFLSGGGGQLSRFDSVIQSFFGIPTEVPNPFKNIEIFQGKNDEERVALANRSGQLLVAVGLALRNVA